jgi:DNA-binding MarR family transcriptional regulator
LEFGTLHFTSDISSVSLKSIIYTTKFSIAIQRLEDYTKLGDLQQKILKHIFTCKSKTENTTHIAKSLGLAQPTVRKSVESLIKEGYLNARQEHKRAKKILGLTPTGAASVMALGVTFEEIERWARRSNLGKADFAALENVKRVITDPHIRDLWYQKCMQYALKNNYFENNKIKNLTPLERTKMQLNFQMEYLNSLSHKVDMDSIATLTDPTTLKEHLKRFDLDKYDLKGYLSYQKELIDMVIKQLDAMD